MRAQLHFDLHDVDDKMAHLRCVKALEMALVLWDLLYNTKKGFEYKIEAGHFETQYDLLDAVHENIRRELIEHGIDIDDLIN